MFPGHVQGSGELMLDGTEILQVDTYPSTIYSAAAIQELHANMEENLREKDAEFTAFQAEFERRIAQLESMMVRKVLE